MSLECYLWVARTNGENAIEKHQVESAVPAKDKEKKKHPAGLGHWMVRVLKECDEVSKDVAADPVHDLRVALRRCRSMADGVMAIDPDKSWKRMKRAGKPLFQALGELRDAQVMMDWVERLGDPTDPVTNTLRDFILGRESDLKGQSLAALDAFDKKQWSEWCIELPRRAARIRLGSAVFKHMALERWTVARDLHNRAMRSRSQAALHQLRIGIKRFRYTVENFLPQLHDAWIDDLKTMQDVLGEVHDLDVLWATACEIKAFPDSESQARWHERIGEQRRQRVEKYKKKMVGKESLWAVWRAELPQGSQIRSAALSRLKIWSAFHDPDFQHSQRVANLAVQLFDELAAAGVAANGDPEPRSILYAAGLMHDVGRGHKEKDHHKRSGRLIRGLAPPLGWTAQDLQLAGVVARYHRGALPQPGHKALGALPAELRPTAVLLAGILRLANAFDSRRDGRVHRLKVKRKDAILIVYAQGYSAYGPIAETVAANRFLLERTLRTPILVRTLAAPRRARRPRLLKAAATPKLAA
jgi:CHAD domain-containing protein/HD superfamily phosphodiesterase